MAADAGRAWILVPAYNEAGRLGVTLASLARFHPRVVVVDDGSDDASYAVACDFPVHVLRHAVNLGQGAALQTALDYALAQGAEYLVTFYADGQHGWCVPDSPVYNKAAAERAYGEMTALYKSKLV